MKNMVFYKGMAAVLVLVMLALAVGGCTPAEPADTPSPTPVVAATPAPPVDEELAYFNEEFFNGEGINIRNQFLSSLYDSPAEIDLFELFYCGIPEGEISIASPERETDGELELVYGTTNLPCPSYKLSTAQMDALLLKYMGVRHVQDTKGVGLEGFTYLEDYDAYYFAHGDTNYRGAVHFSRAEREGALVRLYYEDTFSSEGEKCVTLQEVEGGYRFVSHRWVEEPVIPLVLPQRDPVLTVPLGGLEPYVPPVVTVERRIGDCAQQLNGWSVGEYTICAYRSTDGNTYAAVVSSEMAGSWDASTWHADCFLTLPGVESDYHVGFFTLFGHSGVVISYPGMYSEYVGTTFHDYYTVAADGTPGLLARVHGIAEHLDLDGGGEKEVLTDTQILFQREGRLYLADLPALVASAWPELRHWDYSILNVDTRSLCVRGFATVPDWPRSEAYFQRELYFTGEELLLYAEGETVDHVLQGSDVPPDVMEAAKERVEASYQATKAGAEGAQMDQNFDDWRVSGLSRVDMAAAGLGWPGLELELYCYGTQFHSATPWDVMVVGSAFIDENGWFTGGWVSDGKGWLPRGNGPQSPYLVYVIRDGQRVLLPGGPSGEADVGSPSFLESLTQTLEENGLLPAD